MREPSGAASCSDLSNPVIGVELAGIDSSGLLKHPRWDLCLMKEQAVDQFLWILEGGLDPYPECNVEIEKVAIYLVSFKNNVIK